MKIKDLIEILETVEKESGHEYISGIEDFSIISDFKITTCKKYNAYNKGNSSIKLSLQKTYDISLEIEDGRLFDRCISLEDDISW